MNHAIMFLERHNKTKIAPACFSFLLFRTLVIVITSLHYIALAKTNSNKENLKEMEITLPNIPGIPEGLKN